MTTVRFFAGLIFAPAAFLVAALTYVSFIGYLQWQHQSAFSQLHYFVVQVIAFPGLLPLVTAGVLLFCARTWRDLGFAVAACVVLFVIHYVVAVYGGHEAYSTYWPIQGVELVLCGFLIWLRRNDRWVFRQRSLDKA